jgi:hypothetical protein
MPDLASRLRDALRQGGIDPLAMGSATAGRHTVVTVRLPVGNEQVLTRIAERLGASVSISPEHVEGARS